MERILASARRRTTPDSTSDCAPGGAAIIEESLEGEAAEALGREPSPHPNPFIQQEPDLTP